MSEISVKLALNLDLGCIDLIATRTPGNGSFYDIPSFVKIESYSQAYDRFTEHPGYFKNLKHLYLLEAHAKLHESMEKLISNINKRSEYTN